jgi:hypothetical protein
MSEVTPSGDPNKGQSRVPEKGQAPQPTKAADLRPEGTDGRPNIQIITDYGSGAPVIWFQLHTMVRLNDPGTKDELTRRVAQRNPEAVYEYLVQAGQVVNDDAARGRLLRMLREFFS